MRHESTGANSPSIEVRLNLIRPTFESYPDFTVTEEAVQVRGRSGVARTETVQNRGEQFTTRTLYWPEPSGNWITVRTANVTAGALARYAEGLRPGSMPVDPPFTFDLVPEGMTVAEVGASHLAFRPTNVPIGGSFEGKLVVMYNADVSGDPATWPLRVGGRPASVIDQDGGRSLQVSLGPGKNLVFQVPANVVISDADLFRMAAGTHVTGSAELGRG
jgi:hypothetical protein